eukprot:6176277-Pleurochrysis_carterae.AAC.2
MHSAPSPSTEGKCTGDVRMRFPVGLRREGQVFKSEKGAQRGAYWRRSERSSFLAAALARDELVCILHAFLEALPMELPRLFILLLGDASHHMRQYST